MMNRFNKVKNEKIIYNKLKDIEGNCLISFGKAYIKDSDYLQSHYLCEIEFFNPDDSFRIVK